MLKPLIVTGSKREIADAVSRIDGVVREAIVFVDEPSDANRNGSAAGIGNGTGNGVAGGAANGAGADIFAEMEPYTVRRGDIDDSRDAIYRRGDGE